MSNKDKLIHELFVGKVSSILGMGKTAQLLKEAKEAFEFNDNVFTTEYNEAVDKIEAYLKNDEL